MFSLVQCFSEALAAIPKPPPPSPVNPRHCSSTWYWQTGLDFSCCDNRICPRNAHRELMSNREMGRRPTGSLLKLLSVYIQRVCRCVCVCSHLCDCDHVCTWRMRGTRCWSPTCGSGRRGMMRTWSGIKRTMMDWMWSTSPAAWCGGLTLSSITSTPVRHTNTYTQTQGGHNHAIHTTHTKTVCDYILSYQYNPVQNIAINVSGITEVWNQL